MKTAFDMGTFPFKAGRPLAAGIVLAVALAVPAAAD